MGHVVGPISSQLLCLPAMSLVNFVVLWSSIRLHGAAVLVDDVVVSDGVVVPGGVVVPLGVFRQLGFVVSWSRPDPGARIQAQPDHAAGLVAILITSGPLFRPLSCPGNIQICFISK